MTDLIEGRLRRALHESESTLLPAPDLAAVTAARGRIVVRRRRAGALAGSVAAVVVIAAGAGLLSRHHDRADLDPARPTTTATTTSESVAPGAWARSLPQGAAPDRAYLAGTILHRADGSAIDLADRGYDDAGMVGETVTGVVVLGEKERPEFHSSYLLVTPSGDVQVLGDGSYAGAREAVVSPDGRYLARDTAVVDLTDMSVVAQIPADAEILIDWTADGIRYWTGDRRLLWRPGSAPKRAPAADRVRGELTRSPDGRWVVTRRLQLRDLRTGERTWLAGARRSSPAPWAGGGLAAAWDDDNHVLLTIGSFVVRCTASSGQCERVTDLLPLASNEAAQLSSTRVR